MAVTKIEWGFARGSATRPNGRPRRAVHKPDSIKSSRTSSPVNPPGCFPEKDVNDASSPPRPWRSLPLSFVGLFAIVLGTPREKQLTLFDVRTRPGAAVRRVGGNRLAWQQEGPNLCLELDAPLPSAPAHAFCIPQ